MYYGLSKVLTLLVLASRLTRFGTCRIFFTESFEDEVPKTPKKPHKHKHLSFSEVPENLPDHEDSDKPKPSSPPKSMPYI